MFAIETKELSYSFSRSNKVVNNLSLQVPEQSIYGFLGPNGAGKTTTIRLLTSMLLSGQNNIFLFGESLKNSQPQIFKNIGTLIETPSLYLHLTAFENLRVIALLRNIGNDRIDEVLSIVGLSQAAKRKVKEFSLGMKQRLGIAMALLPDPKLLILDEPANGLDPQGIIEIRQLLIRLNQELGKTIFVSSHLLGEIEKTCTHIGVIHKGILRYQGTLEEMKRSAFSSGEVIFKISNAAEWLHLIQQDYPIAKQLSQDELVFSFADQNEVTNINRALVMKDVPVKAINVRGGLEEWFLQIIENNSKA